MTAPTMTVEVMIATKEDIGRLEGSIKELTEVVKNVILLGERQSVQGKRIGDLETQLGVLHEQYTVLDKKVDSWINRTAGGWFVLVVLGAIVEVFLRK